MDQRLTECQMNKLTPLKEELDKHFTEFEGKDECDHCGRENQIWCRLDSEGQGEGYWCDNCALNILLEEMRFEYDFFETQKKTMVLYYHPTKQFYRVPFGIKRLDYHNELVLCMSWGYENGKMTELNEPDNWKIAWFE